MGRESKRDTKANKYTFFLLKFKQNKKPQTDIVRASHIENVTHRDICCTLQ